MVPAIALLTGAVLGTGALAKLLKIPGWTKLDQASHLLEAASSIAYVCSLAYLYQLWHGVATGASPIPSDADEPHFAMLADNSLHGFAMLTVWFVAIGVPLLITRAEYLAISVKWPQAFWIVSIAAMFVYIAVYLGNRHANQYVGELILGALAFSASFATTRTIKRGGRRSWADRLKGRLDRPPAPAPEGLTKPDMDRDR
ncbi:Uncharacterised protein [Mycobacteroides abscessus subsp. abscessus]|nr:Uncharacterised protein [Mycobacteroides abscessus subsp. abscessus]SKR35898.1 Uncharacterised protein [Mycobacteroides abscessus subsp. abscessus]